MFMAQNASFSANDNFFHGFTELTALSSVKLDIESTFTIIFIPFVVSYQWLANG